jgi:hypothetical protein
MRGTCAYACHRNTVRHWLGSGLEAIDDSRPTLVRGDALNAFHLKRRLDAKRPCGLGQIYCPPCGAPKRPADDMVDVVRISEKLWKVTGLCPTCGRAITQRVGTKRLAAFRSFAGFAERKGADD